MSSFPKVSVILTSFNHAKYLREAIESALNQTYKDFELIIWDDASTDDSWDIIRSYKDQRIRTFRETSNDIVRNFRTAILEVAQGEYIAIHHSDDVWMPDKLEKQVEFLEKHLEYGAVFSWAQTIDEEGQPFQDADHFYSHVFEQPNRSRHEWLNYFFYNGNALCHPSLLIRKECYEEVGPYRFGFAQLPDFDMWVRLCMKHEIYVMPEKLVRFRVRSNEANVSGNRPPVHIRGQFELLQIYANYLEIKDRDDFLKIFPSAQKFFANNGDFSIAFALAMMALETLSHAPGRLFGQQILFNLLNIPEQAQKINSLYGYQNSDLLEITAKHDIFSIIAVSELYANIQSLINEKQALIGQLNGILQSQSWRLVQHLQRVKFRFLPDGSRRERMARIAWRGFRILRSQGLRIFLYQAIERVLGKTAWYYQLQDARRVRGSKGSRKFKPVKGLSHVLQEKARKIEELGIFDYEWYLSDNPAVFDTGVNPVEHYLMHGIRDERPPTPLFNTMIYSKALGVTQEDALIHFAESGRLFAPGAYRSAEILMTAQKRYQAGLKMELVKDDRITPKKYVVYFQCGSGSIHEKWMTAAADRNWDLIVNHYDRTYLGKIPCDVEFIQDGTQPGTKFTSIDNLLSQRPDILAPYQYVLFLDDDILFTENDVNRLFLIADENGLDCAQASLSSDSYCAHPVCKNAGKSGIRHVNAVEIMMPILSQKTLRASSHLFNQTISGWGLDVAISKTIGRGSKIAVIDDVIGKHTKPINLEEGAFYKMLHHAFIYPEIELTHLQRIYGFGRSLNRVIKVSTIFPWSKKR